MPLPPDRAHMATEQPHGSSIPLDGLDSTGLVELMADESLHAAEALRSMAGALATFIDELVPRMRQGGRLIYLGAGTSGRLGVLDASECPPTFQSSPGQVLGMIAGGDAALRTSSERREDEWDGAVEELEAISAGPADTVLGIAAGGTTPWVLGGIEHARSRGCMTGLLCCAVPEGVDADHLLLLETGPEILTGSTRLKAGTATKITLNTITTSAFTQLGKVHGSRMVDLRATNDKLHDRALRILCEYAPSLDRTEADGLLGRCDGELKTAIVAACRSVEPSEARSLVEAADGRLRDLLGE